MPLEAVRSISEAEDASRKMKADAVAAAKKAASDAEREGRAELENASRRAAEETGRLIQQSEERARAVALKLAEETEKKKAELRQSAMRRLDEAASFIVERIVSG